MPTIQRIENYEKIDDFGNEFFVECPRCGKCALVRDHGVESTSRITLRCPSCAYARQRMGQGGTFVFSCDTRRFMPGDVGIGAPVDWYFHLPLWLQTSYRHHRLWAYNIEHLDFLERFVSARQRMSVRGAYGWSNQSLMNRLPIWMKQAKNRAGLLKAIRKLRDKIDDL